MIYFVTTSGSAVTGAGSSPDGTLPPGAIECTQAEAGATGPWSTVVGGALVVGTPPAPPPPTLAEQAMSAIGAGLTITSPTLGVTAIPFDVGPDTQNHITAEVTSILLDGTFVGGASTIAWPDLIIPYPAQHLWTVDQFKVFARAQGAYVAALYKVINGTATTLPPASVTLA